jgi:hypothetical protein
MAGPVNGPAIFALVGCMPAQLRVLRIHLMTS